MSDFVIRKIEKDDYENYNNLINAFKPTNFSLQQYESMINMNANTDIFVIEIFNNNENEKILIGSGTILYERKFIHNYGLIGHIEDIFIRENYRIFGFGKKLIDHLMKEGRHKNCYKIILNCNKEIEKFYEKCGLKKNGIEMANYF